MARSLSAPVATLLERYNSLKAETHSDTAAAILAIGSCLIRDPDASRTVAEASDYLKVSENRVRELCSQGKLTHHRIGNAEKSPIRFTKEDLDEFRERSSNTTVMSGLARHMG